MNCNRMVVLLLTGLLAASGSLAAQDDARPLVVATTTQARDALEIVAGERIELIGLMGAGVDPHLYRPTEADVRAMNRADAIFYSGLHLEGQFGDVLAALGERDVLVVALSDPVKRAGFTIGGFTLSEAYNNVDDPHFWFDPRNWQLSIDYVAEQLALLDPAGADVYAERAAAYNGQLDLLFDWAREAMAAVPEEQRVLVTSHDAFQYFGQAFGWEVRGLQGLSTEDEAGVADVQALVEFVIERDIPVLFVESSVPPNAIESVREGAAAQGHDIGVGLRELYSDAMGAPEDFGGTYVGMLAGNVSTVLQSWGLALPHWPEKLLPAPPQDLVEVDAQAP
ncbi:MAG: zinc ABC transporter substrate-binding protein [Anaerolineaceae bacterium]|nr:zinc ABC transporter substrate-binding protein [Anaerolineaceae bacterium]